MENKKMTTPIVSVGADTEQSPNVCNDSITDLEEDFKEIEEMQREIFRQMQPSYLKTVSMADLYETDFEAQSALIDNLLYRGTYLFVGSPKVGKSFMMAQLAYHISTGTPIWNYKVKQATVLYFALEDDYPRLQRRLFKMFGADGTEILYFATQCKTLDGGLDEQIRGFIREHPDTGLIIIDTLKRVREVGGADYSYASDYDVVAKLKALAATKAFETLINDIKAKYILLSYNNMAEKGNCRSNAKISDDDIMRILSQKGAVKVFEESYKAFTTGKSDISENAERLFLCICFDEE